MKLSSAKHANRPKPFIDDAKLKLYIAATTNDKNQFTSFTIKYRGHDALVEVKGMDIEAAWKLIERFIIKHHRA